jgi:hypothetical protein
MGRFSMGAYFRSLANMGYIGIPMIRAKVIFSIIFTMLCTSNVNMDAYLMKLNIGLVTVRTNGFQQLVMKI